MSAHHERDRALERYDAWANGAQTLEKHIRWEAERIVKRLEGGFATDPAKDYVPFRLPFRVEGRTATLEAWAPAGCHGFALQLVLEDQLREQVAAAIREET